ncbi:MAG TPA: uroporphyrinogen-III C-methyltransferase [Acidimicrobiales bacterium]|nr:uroporphyrinogen-III C-methyltransferase [Acidimicrobiales bacterium]
MHLVGAGPGGIDTLTLRALRLLTQAEVVVHDRLIDEEVLALIPAGAERIDVGKPKGASASQALINELLVSLSQRFDCVVRLKGGDPFVFGRGGEELIALRAAGVDFEVVPGVSSAFAAPALAGIPVTHRGLAGAVLVVTGHAGLDPQLDVAALTKGGVTLVVLMGIERRREIAERLIEGGVSGNTPLAVIERAYTAAERVVLASLDELAALEVNAPAVIVVGAVAALPLGELRQLADSRRD